MKSYREKMNNHKRAKMQEKFYVIGASPKRETLLGKEILNFLFHLVLTR